MYPTSMCGKPHPKSFRTVVHSDRVCRLVFEPETGNFWRCRGAAQPAGPVHAIFGGVPRPTRLGVLNSSPYAYQKAVSLVRAIVLAVRCFRSRNFYVGYDPQHDNPYHGGVWQDAQRGSKLTRGVRKTLLRESQWLVPVP